MDFAAAQAEFAEALLDAGRPLPAQVTTARGRADASRFAVYRNNVHVGLRRALARRFPVAERLVGAEFFAGMAQAFAQTSKPRSPLMFEYGDSFPDFVTGFGPAASLPYLPDVVRLETALGQAYHAADAEPYGIARLAAIAPEDLFQLRLLPHPAARLLHSEFPVGSIWLAHRQDTVEALAAHHAESVLVTRPALQVHVRVLAPADAAFAAALLAGLNVGGAAERAFGEAGDFDFGTALVGLVRLGAFRTDSETTPEHNP